MAEKTNRAVTIFVANKTFLIAGNLWVRQGDTVVAGHPILRGRKEMFRPFAPTFDLDPEPESAPATPDAAPAGPAPSEEAPA